jgi:hypothetical protein
LLKEQLKRLSQGGPASFQSASTPRPSPAAPDAAYAASLQVFAVEPEFDTVYTRHSRGLEQFFSHIENQEGLSILDLAGVTQANVGFITNLGHRLHSEDFLRTLLDAFNGSDGDLLSAQADPERVQRFLRQNLDFPEQSLDGVLVWDALEFLATPLLKATVDRLYEVVKPGCYLLAFFHADENAGSVPVYSYRIGDARTLLLAPRGVSRPAQLFNNRGIERLFQRFQSVKFFLTRAQLREVIITR